jgi:DNA-binding IclR family transcriptional regulator
MCTFCDLGYARRDPETERFSLTLKIFELGTCVFDRVDLVKLAGPVLSRLSAATQETVHLAVLDDQRLVYLTKIESTHALRVSMQSRVGMSAPEYCTGVGKTLLAWADAAFLEAYLSRCEFVKYTDKTITDRLKFAAELQAIRNQGWAMDDEEHEFGVRCAAAPIRDRSGGVVAALSVSGPSVRMTDERIEVLRGLVIAAAREISSELGFKSTDKK